MQHEYSTFLDQVRAAGLESSELDALLESEQMRLKQWEDELPHGQDEPSTHAGRDYSASTEITA